jgi:voltage-gated potassium channel
MKQHLKKAANSVHLHIFGVEPPHGFFSAAATLFSLLLTGTLFYSYVEGWTYLDSLYFSVITITTVGYGDLHPTTPASKIFTMFLIFAGIGLGVFVITSIADSFRKGREKRLERLETLVKKTLRIEE